ncbi:MAG: carboxymuconolactone decarboxylase family protein [Rhodoferax sp.]|jgi:alkylhydroperoxidase/carboxymuconolactone decarboxylase family protein YurZ|nr:carboxymuconolactone decarboxylase family protein [Rhodoferax sp.]
MQIEQAVDGITRHYGPAEWIPVMATRAPAQTIGLALMVQGILEEGPLAQKIKHFMLFVICVSQGKTPMARMHHTAARRLGATDEELHEVLLVFVASRGIAIYIDGAAIAGLPPVSAPAVRDDPLPGGQQMLAYFESAMGQLPEFVSLLATHKPAVFKSYYKLRSENLKDGNLTQKHKELMLVALNTAERYQRGIEIHARAALQCGATQEELIDAMATAILAGGIPGWIEAAAACKSVTAGAR